MSVCCATWQKCLLIPVIALLVLTGCNADTRALESAKAQLSKNMADLQTINEALEESGYTEVHTAGVAGDLEVYYLADDETRRREIVNSEQAKRLREFLENAGVTACRINSVVFECELRSHRDADYFYNIKAVKPHDYDGLLVNCGEVNWKKRPKNGNCVEEADDGWWIEYTWYWLTDAERKLQ